MVKQPSYIAGGRHVLADLEDVAFSLLDDIDTLEKALVEAAILEGVTVLEKCSHRFHPCGVTILLLLSESHVSIHTYPDQNKAFFDAFTCGSCYDPANIFFKFVEKFGEINYKITRIGRGVSLGEGYPDHGVSLRNIHR